MFWSGNRITFSFTNSKRIDLLGILKLFITLFITQTVKIRRSSEGKWENSKENFFKIKQEIKYLLYEIFERILGKIRLELLEEKGKESKFI